MINNKTKLLENIKKKELSPLIIKKSIDKHNLSKFNLPNLQAYYSTNVKFTGENMTRREFLAAVEGIAVSSTIDSAIKPEVNYNPEKELQAILDKKIKTVGKITPDMIDDKVARLLFDISIKQTDKSYAPYSNYHVGAAVISENGKIYKGCNVENSSYGLTVCAERVALFNMVANEGHNKDGSAVQIAGLAIVVKEAPEPASPCGACRQVIEEFNNEENAKIILGTVIPDTPLQIETLKNLLPKSFGPKDLKNAK